MPSAGNATQLRAPLAVRQTLFSSPTHSDRPSSSSCHAQPDRGAHAPQLFPPPDSPSLLPREQASVTTLAFVKDPSPATGSVPTRVFDVDVSATWCVGSVAHGGYLLCILTDAVIRHQELAKSAHVDPAHLTSQFFSATVPGKAQVEIKVVSTTKRWTRLDVDLFQWSPDANTSAFTSPTEQRVLRIRSHYLVTTLPEHPEAGVLNYLARPCPLLEHPGAIEMSDGGDEVPAKLRFHEGMRWKVVDTIEASDGSLSWGCWIEMKGGEEVDKLASASLCCRPSPCGAARADTGRDIQRSCRSSPTSPRTARRCCQPASDRVLRALCPPPGSSLSASAALTHCVRRRHTAGTRPCPSHSTSSPSSRSRPRPARSTGPGPSASTRRPSRSTTAGTTSLSRCGLGRLTSARGSPRRGRERTTGTGSRGGGARGRGSWASALRCASSSPSSQASATWLAALGTQGPCPPRPVHAADLGCLISRSADGACGPARGQPLSGTKAAKQRERLVRLGGQEGAVVERVLGA